MSRHLALVAKAYWLPRIVAVKQGQAVFFTPTRWRLRIESFLALAVLQIWILGAQGQVPTVVKYQSPSTKDNLMLVGGMQTDNSNFTFSGGFSAAQSGLVFDTSNGDSSGRVLYANNVELVHSCRPLTLTSFSTLISVDVKNYSGDPVGGISFIITDGNTTQSHNFFAVEIDFMAENSWPFNSDGQVNVSSFTSNVSRNFRGLQANVSLTSWDGLVFWIEYNDQTSLLKVSGYTGFSDKATMFYGPVTNLSKILAHGSMYVGLSGSTLTGNSTGQPQSLVIDAWTFNSDGPPPDVPRNPDGSEIVMEPPRRKKDLGIIAVLGLTTVPSVLLFLSLLFIIYRLHKRNSRFSKIAKKYEIEEALLSRVPKNFKYKVLNAATKEFSPDQVVGTGGFGTVYRGTLVLQKGAQKPIHIAVKRMGTTSTQGAKQFLAEVKIIGQVQHRNLVPLIGWCHDRDELLLVYEYMPNGSVDQHLFPKENAALDEFVVLTWARRLKILSGVATALVYLHEEAEQRVLHRDVKSSNVMLDKDFNARLGDFGLARLSDHDQAPQTTVTMAGTFGYLAPELPHTFKATEKSDVYSFGAMVLEVATGRRPIIPLEERRTPHEILLVDCVWCLYGNARLLDAADSRLENGFDKGEMMMVLKIGLLSCHPDPDQRPNMREVLNIWRGSSPFPNLPKTKPASIFVPTGGVEYDIRETADSSMFSTYLQEFREQSNVLRSGPLSTSGPLGTPILTSFKRGDSLRGISSTRRSGSNIPRLTHRQSKSYGSLLL